MADDVKTVTWQECIGQGLYDGVRYGKRPECVFTLANDNDVKYVEQLKAVAKAYKHLNLKIKVVTK